MASSIRRVVSLTVALMGLLAGSFAVAAEAPAGWQHTVFIYGMGASIDGEAQIGPIEVAVDVGMSDVFDALEFGDFVAVAIPRVDSFLPGSHDGGFGSSDGSVRCGYRC